MFPLRHLFSICRSRPLIGSFPFSQDSSQPCDFLATTGYSFKTSDGKRKAKYGIYFGENDKRNRLVEMEGEGTTHVRAMLTGLVKAIRMHTSSDPLTIRTDFKLKGDYRTTLSDWSRRDFQLFRGGPMPNADLLRELHEALDTTAVNLEFCPSVENGGRNYVTSMILSGSEFRNRQKKSMEFAAEVLKVTSGETRDASGRLVATPSIRPAPSTSSHVGEMAAEKEGGSAPSGWHQVLAAAGYREAKNGYATASYSTLWPRGEAGGGLAHRLTLFPITRFRAELMAIEEALTQAAECGLGRVLVRTDSAHFIKYWKSNWRRADGETASNKWMFDRIRDLATKRDMEVRFMFDDSVSHDWEKIKDRCEEGLSFPMVPKDRQEYDMTVQEIVEEGVSEALRGSGTTRVRVFKKGTNMPPGLLWDTVDDSSSATFDHMESGSLAQVMLAVLEKAVSLSLPSLVIRTDSPLLIRSVQSWLPVWSRSGYRNSLHKPIKDDQLWMKVSKELKHIQIHWELMSPPSPLDLSLVLPFKIQRKKKGEDHAHSEKEPITEERSL